MRQLQMGLARQTLYTLKVHALPNTAYFTITLLQDHARVLERTKDKLNEYLIIQVADENDFKSSASSVSMPLHKQRETSHPLGLDLGFVRISPKWDGPNNAVTSFDW